MFEERSDRAYADIPEAQQELLRVFWWAHPYHRADLDGRGWPYLAGGEGRHVLLLIPGGHLPAQFWFAMLPELESDYRVLALDALTGPDLLDLDRTAERLITLIEQQGSLGAAILAHGEAGLVAQHLLRYYPHRVQSMMLVTSPWLDARAGQDTISRVTRWLARRAPAIWARHASAGAAIPAETGSHWTEYARAFLQVTSAAHTPQELLGLQAAAETARQRAEAGVPLAGWRGRCLVVAASDDWRTAREADDLAASLPNAELHWFEQGGQALPLLYPEALCAALHRLLAQTWTPADPDGAPYLQGEDRS